MHYLKWIGDGQRVVEGYPQRDIEVASVEEAAGLVFGGLYASADTEVVALAMAIAAEGLTAPEAVPGGSVIEGDGPEGQPLE